MLDLMVVTLFFLMIGAIGFQIYAFNQYRSDVYDNRAILCEAPSLIHERYCRDFRNGTMEISPP